MQGKLTFRVTVQGEAAHAGTVPLSQRKDALMAALRCVQTLYDRFDDGSDVLRLTVGRFEVMPGAPSVVPSSVVFSIDVRHPDNAHLKKLGDRIFEICREMSRPCFARVEQLSRAETISFHPEIRELLHRMTTTLGIDTIELPSTAGHDSRYVSDLCPTGMLFIQCWNGETHNDLEYAAPSHMADGAKVLAGALLELAT